jgi:hypothetical protein
MGGVPVNWRRDHCGPLQEVRMTSVLLHIFFRGMIVFVQDRPAANMMSAYVIADTSHNSSLKFLSSSTMPQGVPCTSKAGRGSKSIWGCSFSSDLYDIRFDPPPKIFENSAIPNPKGVRPLAQKNASDPSWLVKMANVDGDIGGAKKFSDVSDDVLLRMEFGWKSVRACHLDQVKDDDCEGGECEFKIYPERFATSASNSSGHVQAVAEEVMFELEFPSDQVKVILSKRDGSGSGSFYLDCVEDRCEDLYVFNDPESESIEASPLDDIGMHFLRYYDFALGSPKKRMPIRLKEVAVPLSVGKQHQLLTCPADNLIEPLGFQTRVICPMAVFEN